MCPKLLNKIFKLVQLTKCKDYPPGIFDQYIPNKRRVCEPKENQKISETAQCRCNQPYNYAN